MLKKELLNQTTVQTYDVAQLDAAIKALYRGATVQLRELNGNLVQLPRLPQLKKRLWHATTVFTRAQQAKIDSYNDKVIIEQRRIVAEIREQYGKDAYNEQVFVKGQYQKLNVTRERLLQALNAMKLDDLRASQQFIEFGIKATTQIRTLINNSPIELLEVLYNELAPAYGFQTGKFTWETDLEHSFEPNGRDQVEYANQQHIIWTEAYYWEAEPEVAVKSKQHQLLASNNYVVNPRDVILVLYYQLLNEDDIIDLETGYYTCECGHILRAINKADYTYHDATPNYKSQRELCTEDDADNAYCPYCDRPRKTIEEI